MVAVVVITVAVSTLATANMALIAVKVSLTAARVSLTRVLDSYWRNTLKVPELDLAISTRHDRWSKLNIGSILRDIRVDSPSLVNHIEHKEVGMDLDPHRATSTRRYLTLMD